MAQLYRVPVGLELYAMRSPQDIRIENRVQQQKTGMLKQTHVTEWDRAVIRDAAKTIGAKSYLTLHPAWMYQTMAPFWESETGLAWAQERLRYTLLDPPELPEGVTLPEKFAAMRFYFRYTYPYHPETLRFARETIAKVAQSQPVILLNSGLHADEHLDFEPKDIPNVFTLKDFFAVTPENNLLCQAAVLARSLGFVGTYGGLAQLALRYRKPVVSFYTQWGGTSWSHRHMSEALAVQLGIPFRVLQLGELPLLQQVIPQVTWRGESS